MRITFRREERETGLARVCQGTRGWDINVNGVRVGGVRPSHRHSSESWFWYVGSNVLGLPYISTCNEPVTTSEEAKLAAKEWVLAQSGYCHAGKP